LRRFCLASWFCLVALLHVPSGDAASKDEEKRGELAEVKERIRSIQASKENFESRKSALMEQLSIIERRYGRLAKTLRELETQAQAQARRVGELQRQCRRLQDAVQTQHKGLAGQARAAYAAGRQEWLKLAINQEDPARLARVLAYYNYLNRARTSLLQGMQEELTEARQLQDELLAESERLNGTRQRAMAEKAELAKSKQARRQVLAELERGLRDKDVQLKRLQENEQRLQRLLVSIQPAADDDESTNDAPAAGQSSSAPQGQTICPVKGRLVEQFGSSRMGGRWGGVLIAAQEGAPVRAVSDGRVAFSDWLRGYGLLTIVDHGDGYMSLYAFNQSLYKNVGDRVGVGEVIATVGASGGRTEPGLYFGMRERGRPVNPLLWCNLSD
jgi:septal ring factor EnvC (AmiA/AmiB activator)